MPPLSASVANLPRAVEAGGERNPLRGCDGQRGYPREHVNRSHPLRVVLLRGARVTPWAGMPPPVWTSVERPRHVPCGRCATDAAPLIFWIFVVPLGPCSTEGTKGNFYAGVQRQEEGIRPERR